MFIKNYPQTKGFSLIEVAVAISIIMLSLIPLVTLAHQNISTQKVSLKYLTASMLAQEGLELVRNVRDENVFTSSSTDPFRYIVNPADTTYAIGVDFTSNNIVIDYTPDSIDAAEARLYLTPAGFYTHQQAGNTPTEFYRLIRVIDTSEARFEAQIKWTEKDKTYSYSAYSILTHW
ncbi:prepilin-type N-terminal cleavage/methylation domain-containing protein [Candidatus Parcubacteria bacterium]|nr:MAG: prepilin-type N-terminal cleavage/methylation domain-containing protein [Candidatus Parcubacteria bacterium]